METGSTWTATATTHSLITRDSPEIDEGLLHCPNDDGQMFVELRRRQSRLKEEIERFRHEVLGNLTLH